MLNESVLSMNPFQTIEREIPILWGCNEEPKTKSSFTLFMCKDLTLEELPMLLEQPFSTALSFWYYHCFLYVIGLISDILSKFSQCVIYGRDSMIIALFSMIYSI